MIDEKQPHMRVERSGPIEPLTPRFVAFLEERLGAISLDGEGDVEERPDFACLGGLVAIEIKSLETDPSERLKAALGSELESEHWPDFYGTLPIQAILKQFPNAGDIQTKLVDRLGRTVVRVIKKANDQLGRHTERSKRKNIVRLVVLLNEDHPEYDPTVITFIVQRELARVRNGGYRNNDIDAVIYLSDRHVVASGSAIYLPALVIHGPLMNDKPWKNELINLILSRWAAWHGVPILPDGAVQMDSIVTAEHVPDTMKRHELWALEYRRRPYMRKWQDTDLRNLWDHILLICFLSWRADAPMRVPKDGLMQSLETFAHLNQEVSQRGLPLGFLSPDPVRWSKVVSSLPYGAAVADWLRSELQLPLNRPGTG